VDAGEALQRGREAAAGQAWEDAHRWLSGAARLEADDLELLATSAFMLGRDDEYEGCLERAHQLHLDAGEPLRAVRCAFWLGIHLMLAGQVGRATGWLARAQRLLDREGGDCVERGYLLIPLMFEHEGAGDLGAAAAIAGQAAAVGARFGDSDLFGLAVHAQGAFLVREGHVAEGLGLLDEAMVAVTTGELSPIASGLVYCGVILGCQDAYDVRRAQEWTAALTRWCEQQPDMVAFTGRCLVHRAEIMWLHGAWADAVEEARRAGLRCVAGHNERAAGEAAALKGDVHRLRGDLAAAEEAYREASRHGWEPQPGLALLRLAQGDADAAAAAIRRALDESSELTQRARLLPAYVEITLAVGEVADGAVACDELEAIAAGHPSEMLGAIAAHARGAVEHAGGDAGSALVSLRRAAQVWQQLEAPYEAARARALVGLACRALGDDDAAAFELEAARGVFAALGAAPDVARVEALARPAGGGAAGGLTPRELQVLRLVAAGKTNKAIGAGLVLSERTVDRHVSNILAKLGVASRAAATARAYEQHLL
jgi:DNA-binding CsgD family transcriptional regulator/tetratricopeptide (TPR) repeat protein